MSDFTIMGTGGVPNLRVVEDYAPITGPEFCFELHTQIKIPHGTATQIRAALAARNLPAVTALVLADGTIDPDVPRARLEAWLNALFFVP